jgi:VCBS repeat-containing protein
MALEQRFMFDGAALADASQTLDSTRTTTTAPILERSAETTTESRTVELARAGVVRAVPDAREILFVDSAVAGIDQLLAMTRSDIEVVLLDAQTDPWQQMTEALARHHDVQAVHLVSHGETGQLVLGGRSYDSAALQTQSATLASWQAFLTQDADILLYGCHVGADSSGALLLDTLARLTLADIAASTDATGWADRGGDWLLEQSTGRVEADLFASTEALSTYDQLLAVVTVSFASGSDTGTTGDNLTNLARPSFTFTPSTSAGSYVLTIDGVAQTAVAAAITGGTAFTFQVPSDLASGSHTVSVETWSNGTGGGTSRDTGSYTFTVDRTAPTPTVAATSITTAQSVNVQSSEAGTAYLVNSSVTVSSLASITGAADNLWNSVAITTANTSTALSASGLTAGTYKVYVLDAAGNLSSASANSVTVSAPVSDSTAPDTSITSQPSSLINSRSATFNWSGSDNVGVTGYDYRIDGGSWTATTDTSVTLNSLSDGSHTFEVRAKDAAGNVDGSPASYSWTIDATAPAAPVITAVTDNVGSITGTVADNGVTDDTVLVLSGTAEANSTVSVYNGVTLLGTATANGSGAWSYTTGTLSNASTYVFTAKATDAAGNTGSASSSHTVTIDTAAPAAPVITAVTDNVGSITGTVADNGVTDDTVLVLSGTAEANSTVSVYNGVTLLGTATANGSGAWSYTTGTLSNASIYAFSATARDAAGNTSGSSASYTVTVDTSAPTTTVSSLAFSADTGTAADFVTATAAQTLSGTLGANLQAGESVQVSLDNGSTWQSATATVGSNSFSLAVTLSTSSTLKVRVVDAAGNTGPTYSQDYVLDVTAPTTTLGGYPAGPVKSAATFSWSGSDAVAVAGYEYRVDGGGWTATTATSVTISGLAAGDHTFELRAIDSAGNVDATPESRTWTVDPLIREPALTAANSEFGVLLQGTPFDPVNDTQSNAADTDLVGDANNPLLLGAYDSTTDEMYFRVRIGDPTMVKVGSTYVPRFTGVALIGLDANNDGRLDLMLGVDGRNNGLGVVLYDPGTGANDRPSTTSITNQTAAWGLLNSLTLSYDTVNKASSTSTYRYELIRTNPTDVGASDGQDAYLTFKLPFNVIAQRLATTGGGRTVAITRDVDGQLINESSSFRFALFTLTQNNSINGDVGGISKSNADYSKPWSEISGTISFTKPTVLDVSGTMLYAENNGTAADAPGLPKALAPTATLSDLDTSNFRGSALVVGFGNDSWQSGDALTVLGGSNGITVDAGQVYYNGASIGSYSWDAATHTLSMTFGPAGITADAVQALLRSVAYSNSSERPDTSPRTVTFDFTDPDGYVSSRSLVTVVVESINDAPVISQSGNLNRTVQNSVAYDSSSAAATLLQPGVNSGLTITDVDAGTSVVEARLAVDKGVLDLYKADAQVSGATTFTFGGHSVEVLGAGTSTLVLRGSVDAINAFLAGGSTAQVVYQPGSIPGEGTQSASLSLTVNDLGNSGTGGNLSATRSAGLLTIEGTPLLLGTFGAALREDQALTSLSTSGTISVAVGSTLGLTPATAISYQGNTLGTAALGSLSIDAGGNWSYTVSNSEAAIQALRAGQTLVETFRVQCTVNDGVRTSAAIGYIEVTISGVNDAPVLQATGGERSYVENAATATQLFTGASAAFGAGESGQSFTALALTVSNIVAGDRLVVDGRTLAIDTGSSGTLTDGGYTVDVSLSGTTATLNIRSSGASAAQLQALVESLRYASVGENPTALNSGNVQLTRTVTLTTLTDSGGRANGGADTAALNLQAVLTITPANDAPGGTDAVLNVARNGSRVLTPADFGYSDPEGDALAGVRITTLQADGVLQYFNSTRSAWEDVALDQFISAQDLADGKLRFRPDADEYGNAYASFGFVVSDGTADSVTANSVTFNVIDNNVAPVTQDGRITLNEDEARTLYAGDFFFSDENGDALESIVVMETGGAGTFEYRNDAGQWAALTPGQSISAAQLAAGRLRFTPVLHASGSDYASLGFKVSDGDRLSDAATLTLDVTPVNDAPAGTDNTLNEHLGEPYTFTESDFGFSDLLDGDRPLAVKFSNLGSYAQGGLQYFDSTGSGETLGDITGAWRALVAGETVTLDDIMAGRLRFGFSDTSGLANFSYSFDFQVQDDGGVANGGVDLDPTPNTFTLNFDAYAPLITVPTERFLNEDGTLVFEDTTAITIAHTEAAGVPKERLRVLLELNPAVGGSLSLAATPPAGVSIENLSADETSFDYVWAGDGHVVSVLLNADGSIRLTGYDNDITAVLAGLVFTPGAQDFSANPDGSTVEGQSISVGNHAYATLKVSATAIHVHNVDEPYDHVTSSANVDLVVRSVNDAPTVGTTGGERSYTEGAAATALFGTTTVFTGPANESAQLLTRLTLSVSGLRDGAAERLTVQGSELALTHGGSGSITVPGGKVVSYAITVSSGTASVTLASSAGLTAAETQALVESLRYRVAGDDPTGGDRTITLTGLSDNGGTALGGTDTAVLNLAATLTVLPVNDAPSARNLEVPLNPSTPYVFGVEDFGFSDAIEGDDLLAVKITSLPATGQLQYLDEEGEWQAVSLDPESGEWRVLASDINDGNLRYLAPATDPQVNPSFDFRVQDDGGTDNGGEDTAGEAHTVRLNIVPLTVSAPVMNEASPYAIFEITGIPLQQIELTLIEGNTAAPGNADIAEAQVLKVWNGSRWVDYGSNVQLSDSGTLLVRVDITAERDDAYEGLETFVLRATNTGGNHVDGTATIKDDGTGDVHDGTLTAGQINRNAGNDDDRSVSVQAHGPVNEGSVWAMFTVTATEGQALNLTLGNTASEADRDARTAGFTLQYSVDGSNWTAYSWNGSSGNRPTVPEGGKVYVRVNIGSEADSDYEGAETFTLTAVIDGGAHRSSSATGTIVDDGSGARYDGTLSSGTPVANRTGLDDDRNLSVNSITVNEASPYAVFRVGASAGTALTLALAQGPAGDGAASASDDSGAPADADYRTSLQYFNGSQWVSYTPGSTVRVPVGSSMLLVRTPLVNDERDEGAEAFTLTATRVEDRVLASGRAVIRDDGVGAIFNESGADTPDAVRDDDRALKVGSVEVNEGSPYAVFTVRGSPNASVTLALADGAGAASATGGGTDYGASPSETALGRSNLEVSRDGGASWTVYSGSATLGADGALLVRTPVVNDDDRERQESFTLTAVQGALTAVGTGVIKDDGTGIVFRADGSENLVASKDDDFDKDGIAPNVEEILATMSASTGNGGLPGDLNGDGVQDADQNALATLAWTTVDRFNQAMTGSLTEVAPIISISVVDAATGRTVSGNQQLEAVRVLAPTDALIGGSKPAAANLTVPWDPIQFAISPQDPVAGLLDIDGDASNGVQVRVLIDISRSGLDEGYFNGYMKYVSASALAAAGGTLQDLDGRPITSSGWYDFMQRTPGGDGARYVVQGGKIMAIELIITDNRFGDNDWTVGRVFDPGVPVRITVTQTRTEVPPVLSPAAVARPPAEAARAALLDETLWARAARPFDTALHALQVPVDPQTLRLTEPVADRSFVRATEDLVASQAWRDVYTPQSAWRALVIDGPADQLLPFRGMSDQHVELGSQGEFGVPWDAFAHTRPDAIVLLVARLADGRELPPWLQLGRRTGIFSYQVPAGFQGELQIELTARDTQGREASTLFKFTIGQEAVKPAARASLSEQLRAATQKPVLWQELQRASPATVERNAPAANSPVLHKVRAG